MTCYFLKHGNAFLVLIVMIIISLPQIAMIWKRGFDKYSFRLLGFTLIAFLGVFSALVTSNTTNATAVFGLLGAIAGYLIGKSDTVGKSDKE